MGYLSTEIEGTGIIFGFLKQIKKFAKLYNTNKFVFAWDSRKSKRKELFSGYRLHDYKELTEEEIRWNNDSFKQFTLIKKEILPELGFYNSFRQKGYEADDVIASLVSTIEDDKVIISADEDLYQLLDDKTIIYDLKKKSEFDSNCFKIAFGIEPKQWAEVKAIAGCSSDKVPGCSGVGEKTAIKYLTGNLNKNSKLYEKIENYLASEEYILYNKLTALPFEGTKAFDVDFDCNFNRNGFIKICNRFKFKSFLMPHNLNDWFDLFR